MPSDPVPLVTYQAKVLKPFMIERLLRGELPSAYPHLLSVYLQADVEVALAAKDETIAALRKELYGAQGYPVTYFDRMNELAARLDQFAAFIGDLLKTGGMYDLDYLRGALQAEVESRQSLAAELAAVRQQLADAPKCPTGTWSTAQSDAWFTAYAQWRVQAYIATQEAAVSACVSTEPSQNANDLLRTLQTEVGALRARLAQMEAQPGRLERETP